MAFPFGFALVNTIIPHSVYNTWNNGRKIDGKLVGGPVFSCATCTRQRDQTKERWHYPTGRHKDQSYSRYGSMYMYICVLRYMCMYMYMYKHRLNLSSTCTCMYSTNPHVTLAYTHNTCTLAHSRAHTHTHTYIAHAAHVDYKFPMENEAEESTRWKKIQQNNLNSKCRSMRAEAL